MKYQIQAEGPKAALQEQQHHLACEGMEQEKKML